MQRHLQLGIGRSYAPGPGDHFRLCFSQEMDCDGRPAQAGRVLLAILTIASGTVPFLNIDDPMRGATSLDIIQGVASFFCFDELLGEGAGVRAMHRFNETAQIIGGGDLTAL